MQSRLPYQAWKRLPRVLATQLIAFFPGTARALPPPIDFYDFDVLVSNDVAPLLVPALSFWALLVLASLLFATGYLFRRARTTTLIIVFASMAVLLDGGGRFPISHANTNGLIKLIRPRAGERDFTDNEKATISQLVQAEIPSAIQLSDATIAYNAHGETFDLRSSWINSDQILSLLGVDYTLVSGSAAVGDAAIYQLGGDVTYTGTVMEVDGSGNSILTVGKWGSAGQYAHAPADVPASYGTASLYRRLSLREPCDNATRTNAQIQNTIDVSLVGLSDPWGGDFPLLLDRLEADLDCELPETTSAAAAEGAASNFSADAEDCLHVYCDDVFYCGPTNSLDPLGPSSGAVWAGPALNYACFLHDLCSYNACVSFYPPCYFSTQSRGTGCDDPFFVECLIITSNPLSSPVDRLVCLMAAALSFRPTDPICSHLPCDGGFADDDCEALTCSRDSPDAGPNGCIPSGNEPEGSPCADGWACTYDETCDTQGLCSWRSYDHLFCNPGATGQSYDPDADCRWSLCLPVGYSLDENGCCNSYAGGLGCAKENSGSPCDDGNACTAGDYCKAVIGIECRGYAEWICE